MIEAVVIGGTGLGAGELVRLLLVHPEVEIMGVISSSSGGKPLASSHSQLEGLSDIKFVSEFSPKLYSGDKKKVLFAALPHGVSAEALSALVPTCLAEDIHVIDLSGDFRLKTPELHKQYYCTSERCEEVAELAEYGIPEINRANIAKAKFVANPGCNASACIFSLLPVPKDWIESAVVFDVKTGVSGAGRTANEVTHFAYRHADAMGYKVLSHRHEPEIKQALGISDKETMFVPHLIPTNRGILTTTYFTSSKAKDISAKFEEFYKNEPFVRVRKSPARLQDVVGSNFCDVSLEVRDNQVVVHSAIDNMLKGMAGVAIHNMNIVFGLEETTGLNLPPLGVI